MPGKQHEGAQVIIFAKAPILGTVKTRLAATLGNAKALLIYQRMLQRCADRLGQGAWHTVFSVTPDDAVYDSTHWPVGVELIQQGEGDLGARMLRALARARSGAPVIVTGSDIPELGAEHIVQALDALAHKDLVFGPSTDGGFYLVGANYPPPPDIFAGVRWSSSSTLAQVITNCTTPTALIDVLDDFDDMAAFARHRDHVDWTALVAD